MDEMTEQWSYLRPDQRPEDAEAIDRWWGTREMAEYDLAQDVAWARLHGRDAFVRSWTAGNYKIVKRQVSKWEVVK